MEADVERGSAERERLRAEAEVLQTEIVRRIAGQVDADRRYRDLFERSDVPLATLSLNGLVQEANAAFAHLLGEADLEAVRGRRVTAFTHPDDRAEDADVLTTLSLGARARAWIVKRRLDGTAMLLLYHLVLDADGEPGAIFVRDASDLLEPVRRGQGPLASLGAALDADPAWRGDLSAVLRHELNTPLALLRGFVGVLGHALGPDAAPPVKGALTGLAEGIDRLARVGRDLDAFMGWSAGPPPATEAVDLGAIAARVLAEVAEPAAAAGVGLALEGPEATANIPGDAAALALALRHVVQNAIAATPGDRNVVVRLAATPELLTVLVEDEGPGLAPADRALALLPFRQLQMGASRPEGGLGLGLAVARGIVEAHGGQLTLAASASGGLAVRLTFPIP